MSSILIVAVFLLVILFMVISSVRYKLHPFFGLILASAVVGLFFFDDRSIIFRVIGDGFGRMLANIAFIIVFGALLGEILFHAKAFDAVARAIFQGSLSRYPDLALGLIGLIVGIPVFCDSGYLVLRNLKGSLGGGKNARRRNTIMLAAGLYLSHTLVPPTPGPLVIAESLGQSDALSDFILFGAVLSLLVLLTLFLVNRFRFRDIHTDWEPIDTKPTLSSEDNKDGLPKLYEGLIPLILPLILIGFGSTSKVFDISSPVLLAMTNPAMALLLSCLVALILNRSQVAKIPEISGEALNKVAPVLLLTGAGGAFGAVMVETVFLDQLNIHEGQSYFVLVLIVFGVAALIKSLQGSSTGAIVVTCSLLAPLLAYYELSQVANLALFAAVGGGSMAVSHTNDSYFWVITKFEDYSIKEAIQGWSLSTLFMGLLTLAVALIVAIFVL